MRGLAAIVALAGMLACAQAAQAATLTKTDSGAQLEFRDPDADVGVNNLDITYCPAVTCGADRLVFNDLNDSVQIGVGVACDGVADNTTVAANTYISCSSAGITNIEVALGGGADILTTDVRGQAAFGGGDSDTGGRVTLPLTVAGGAGADNLTGGQAPDSINAGDANDIVSAGPGNDVIFGGAGGDTINGGIGTDEVNYAARTIGVTVELAASGPNDGSSEDGPVGARDNISTTDVERIVGGSGPDDLRGRTVTDDLRGGAGDDSINAAGGADTVFGGPGTENIEARDGAVDQVDCGADPDVVTADAGDSLTSCDAPPPPEPPEPIVIVRPGPPAPAPPVRALADLGYTFTAGRRGTVLRNFSLETEQGARVSVTCRFKGKACKRTRDLTRARAAEEVRLRGFEGRALPVGAKLTIRVTKDGMIGAVKTMTIRRRRAPSVKTTCIPPGATAPSAC